jgi:hypothetical protein
LPTADDLARPRVASPIASYAPAWIDAERRRSFELMHWQGGAIEIVAGTNSPANPNAIDLLVWTQATYGQGAHTRKWIAADNLATLDRTVQQLGAQWGNVYVRVGTYDKRPNPYHSGQLRYSRAAPRPRRCIVADDIHDLDALRLPPSWATETSPGNYQVGYLCDALISVAEARALAAGLAELERADPSGADAE